jgi:hypothetical protein
MRWWRAIDFETQGGLESGKATLTSPPTEDGRGVWSTEVQPSTDNDYATSMAAR